MHLDEQEQSELTKLNQSLLRCQSITPEDGGTFRIISDFCTKLNMQMQRYDHKDTKNFFESSLSQSVQLSLDENSSHPLHFEHVLPDGYHR